MPTSYSTLLGLALPVTGELSGTWGDEVNNYITQYLDSAVAGTQTISGSQTAVTLSRTTNAALIQAGSGLSTGSSQYQVINCTGNPASALTVTVPSTSKAYLVLNNTSTSQTVTVKGAATTGVTVAAARAALIAWNGTDFELVATDDASKMNGVLAVANGGTGLSSGTSGGVLAFTGTSTITSSGVLTANALVVGGGAGAAPSTTTTGTGVITALGTNIGTAGSFIVNGGVLGTPSSGTLTNATGLPLSTGVTGTLAVANGGTGATTAPNARTNLGATTIGGNLFTLTNPSAVTFPRFNADNTVSALDAATFRSAIGAGTGGGSVTSVSGTGTVQGLTLSGTVTSSGSLTLGGSLSAVSLTSQVSGTLPVANGGTGVTTSTGSGNNVLSTSPTLVTPILGTPTSGTLSNCTVDGTNAVGYRNLPPSGTRTSSYTLTTSDVGKYVQVSTGGSIVIPTSTFAEGDAITLFNNTTGNVTITCSAPTAYIAGTNTVKTSMTLATRGVATILFISSTLCVVTGNVT